jgi:hypothetical protein
MTRLAKDYPDKMVEISCKHCGRHGRTSRSKFVEIVGPETPLPQALTVFVRHAGCTADRPSATNMNAPCKPVYDNIFEA